MTKPSTSSSKCGTCKKIVKDGDKSGIACDNCGVWYHGACAKLSQEDVTLMGRIKGCLWLCDSCLNDDVFNSEAKYNPIIDAKIMKSGMKQIQNSMNESSSHNLWVKMIKQPNEIFCRNGMKWSIQMEYQEKKSKLEVWSSLEMELKLNSKSDFRLNPVF